MNRAVNLDETLQLRLNGLDTVRIPGRSCWSPLPGGVMKERRLKLSVGTPAGLPETGSYLPRRPANICPSTSSYFSARDSASSVPMMTPLDLVHLTPLMERTSGNEIAIGLIDGPVAMGHPDLAGARIREIPGRLAGTCAQASSVACQHGTFVAGILSAKRGSSAPAICPDATLWLRPIFAETASGNEMPSARPEELAQAIVDCLEAGARILNLSAALAEPSTGGQRELEGALDRAVRRGVIVVAAAGNQGTLGSSVITRHPWVIPVAACDLGGRPMGSSNLGRSIGRRGLRAPGDDVTSSGAGGTPITLGGTSAAAPFVTGTIALLWSEFPAAPAATVRAAVVHAHGPRRTTVVPPLLDAWAAYDVMNRFGG